MFDISDRAEIIINILKIYEKVQISGGNVAVKSEILSIFKDIILCRNGEELQKITMSFIDKRAEK